MTAAHFRLHVSGAPSIESPAETAIAEERLWRAVIDVAFRDAINPPLALMSGGHRDSIQAQRDRLISRARHWLLEDRSDFVVVCDLAGRDPHEVREQARRLLGDERLTASFIAAKRDGYGRNERRRRTNA